MSRFVSLQKVRIGTGEPEGEIALNIDAIVAIEPSPGTGGSKTLITISGGRQVNVDGHYEALRDAILPPVIA